MKDRIRPPKDLEKEVLDRLKEDKVFDTKQKGMMFAAAVGFCLYRTEVDSTEVEPKGEGIRLDYFDSVDDTCFIDALAVVTRSDLSVLALERQPERIDLFERYAMLGLQELKKACYDDRPTDPLLGIIALLDRLNRTGIDLLPGLKEML